MTICRCRLSLLPDSQFLSLDSDLSGSDRNGGYQQRMSTWKSWLQCFHYSIPSPYDLQHVLDQPVCSMLWLGLTRSSCVVRVCTGSYTFLGDRSCGLRFSHILMTVMSMQLVHILHVYSLRLALQCHAFI